MNREPLPEERVSERMSRKRFLQLLGVAVVGIAGARLVASRQLEELEEPERSGTPSQQVQEALISTARLLADHLRLREHLGEEALTGAFLLKCSERPSYLSLYERYAREVQLPQSMSAQWVERLKEIYRVRVLGEIAVLILINGGFRAFGFQNFNGYPGGSWHEPETSNAFRISKE